MLVLIAARISGGIALLASSYYTKWVAVGDMAHGIPLYLTNGTEIKLSQIYWSSVLLWFLLSAGCTYYLPTVKKFGVTMVTVESYGNLEHLYSSIYWFQSVFEERRGLALCNIQKGNDSNLQSRFGAGYLFPNLEFKVQEIRYELSTTLPQLASRGW